MLTYLKAKSLLSTARSQSRGKPIARNTRLIDRCDYIAVRLHNTDIIRIYPNGIYRLYTGGWRTSTTKERINRYSPVQVYQRNYQWRMNDTNEDFYDGIQVGNKIELQGIDKELDDINTMGYRG